MEGDEFIRDVMGRPVELIEGLMLQYDVEATEGLGITSSDLERAHETIAESYRRLWQEAEGPTIASEPIPIGSPGVRLQFRLIPPNRQQELVIGNHLDARLVGSIRRLFRYKVISAVQNTDQTWTVKSLFWLSMEKIYQNTVAAIGLLAIAVSAAWVWLWCLVSSGTPNC